MWSRTDFPATGDLEIQTSVRPQVVSYNNPKANGTTEFTISSLISGTKSGTWQTGGNVILVPSTEPTTTVAGGQPLSSTINVARPSAFRPPALCPFRSRPAM